MKMRNENENISSSSGIGQEFVLVEFAGENVHFCLFVTHAIIVSCDSLDTHTYTYSLSHSISEGLELQNDTAMDAVVVILFLLNRDFLASILCNVNTLTHTYQHFQNTRLVLPLNTNISKVKQWNTNKVKL